MALYGSVIAPDGEALERSSFGGAILKETLAGGHYRKRVLGWLQKRTLR